MNIAIVDDMKTDIFFIKSMLSKYSLEHGIDFNITSYQSAEELLENYHANDFQLIFLDIYMEGLSGVDAVKEIRKTDDETTIIFLSSSMEFMQEAFYNHAYDYIEKPVLKDRLYHAMDNFLKKQGYFDLPKLNFFSNRIEYSLLYSDIVMIATGAANYLEIYDKSGNIYQTRMTISAVCDLLKGCQNNSFLLVIRGVLVNMDYIKEFKDGMCYLVGDIAQPVNGRNQKKLEQSWIDYKSSK